jgi:hypothetical protein
MLRIFRLNRFFPFYLIRFNDFSFVFRFCFPNMIENWISVEFISMQLRSMMYSPLLFFGFFFFFLSQDTGRVLECHFNFPRYIITAAAYSARRFPLGPFLTRFTYVNPRFDYESNWKEFLFYEQLYEWDLILLKSSFFALSIFFYYLRRHSIPHEWQLLYLINNSDFVSKTQQQDQPNRPSTATERRWTNVWKPSSRCWTVRQWPKEFRRQKRPSKPDARE